MVKPVNYQTMPKVTFEITAAQRKLMDAHPEVNWSETFRVAIERHAQAAALARQIEQDLSDPRIMAVTKALKRGTAERVRRARRS